MWPALAAAGIAAALWTMAPPRSRTAGEQAASPDRSDPRFEKPADRAGREAEAPLEIPAPGWFAIGKRVVSEVVEDRVLAVAAGVTFYVLLALFPALGAFVSLYGLFADPSAIAQQLDTLRGILPEGGLSIVGEQVHAITAKPGGSLGLATVVGLGVSLWSANSGMKAIFDALNVVYEEQEKRSFIRLNVLSLAFTLGALAILIVAMGAVVVVPVALKLLGLASIGTTVLALARWPVLLVMVALGLAVLYRFGPSRRAAQWRWLSPGSVFASVGWLAASAGFSLYVGRFGSYNATYGSLGAAIGFMTWIWISTIVVLVGAELNAEAEHQTARDTTRGNARPLGSRGARMADEVATAPSRT